MTTDCRRRDRSSTCGRCGILHESNRHAPGRAYCKDCRPDAARFGWYEQPQRAPRGNSVRKAA